MKLVKQIEKMCRESGNSWFLTHQFPKIALYDLQLAEEMKISLDDFQDRKEDCFPTDTRDLEKKRDDHFTNELKLKRYLGGIYNYTSKRWTRSRWFFSRSSDNQIVGFILLKCSNGGYEDHFTHELYFALTQPKYRQQGIMKGLVAQIPKTWCIWLQSLHDVEEVWKKCGFIFYKIEQGGEIIYRN